MRRIDLDDEEIGLNQGDRALNDKTGMAQPDVIFLDRSIEASTVLRICFVLFCQYRRRSYSNTSVLIVHLCCWARMSSAVSFSRFFPLSKSNSPVTLKSISGDGRKTNKKQSPHARCHLGWIPGRLTLQVALFCILQPGPFSSICGKKKKKNPLQLISKPSTATFISSQRHKTRFDTLQRRSQRQKHEFFVKCQVTKRPFCDLPCVD